MMLPEPKHGFDAELAGHLPRRATRSARGIGTRLVATVAAAQRAHGATGMIVWVIAGNKAARAFYEKLDARAARRAAVHVGRHGPGRGGLRLARPARR